MIKAGLKASKLDISIIVPAYKAENIIVKRLIGIKEALDETGCPYEVILVVDGKVDATYEAAMRLAKKFPAIFKVLGYEQNRGKGYAVRYGFAKAKGELIGFIDADEEINPKSITNLLIVIKRQDTDVAVGSKRHKDSFVVYPPLRRLISWKYFLLVKVLFNVGVSDTQAGIKIYKRKVISRILPFLKINSFAFDIEMLEVSRRLGYKICEAPIIVKKVNMQADGGIAFSEFFKKSMEMFIETFTFFLRFKILGQYDNKN